MQRGTGTLVGQRPCERHSQTRADGVPSNRRGGSDYAQHTTLAVASTIMERSLRTKGCSRWACAHNVYYVKYVHRGGASPMYDRPPAAQSQHSFQSIHLLAGPQTDRSGHARLDEQHALTLRLCSPVPSREG